MGWPGYWLILPGLASEAVNQNDVMLIGLLRLREFATWAIRKSGETAPGGPQEGKAMQCAGAGKPIIKFNHCRKYIYSFSVPRRCPLCRQDVGSRKLEEAPVSISNPFTSGHQEKRSFLLKPTQGTFLRYSVFCYLELCKLFLCVVVTKIFYSVNAV